MIKAIGPEWAAYIAKNQEMYPEAMREGQETFHRLLLSGLCWGWFEGREMRGWVLCEPDPDPHFPKQAYCYDLAVLPEYQGKGIGKALWIHACYELRWLDYAIHLHCRKQSYSIVISNHPGYSIKADEFIKDHYAAEYGDDSLLGEDAHELLLA